MSNRTRFSTTLVATMAFASALIVAGCSQGAQDDKPASDQSKADAAKAGTDLSGNTIDDYLGRKQLMRPVAPMARRLGQDYWYIPYAMSNQEQMLAFIQAVRPYIEEGKPLPDELKVPEGEGAAGGDTLYHLREGVGQEFIKNINQPGLSEVSESDIPVIITLPEPDADGAEVLFMDGHVKFIKYGTFPVTKRIIEGLESLDPLEQRAAEGAKGREGN